MPLSKCPFCQQFPHFDRVGMVACERDPKCPIHHHRMFEDDWRKIKVETSTVTAPLSPGEAQKLGVLRALFNACDDGAFTDDKLANLVRLYRKQFGPIEVMA